MKHRRPSLGNDRCAESDSAEAQMPKWDRPLRFSVAAAVVVSVTVTTGSVADGILAVTGVAAAAHGIPRLTSLV